jgi:hypothetical protein
MLPKKYNYSSGVRVRGSDGLDTSYDDCRSCRAGIVLDCRTTDVPAMINKERTNENNTDVDRWADAGRLRINGKPCS